MTADDVLAIYDQLRQAGIKIWVDGGWCVDALLGEQTREHSDLDIAVHRKDNARLRKLLEKNGYHEEKRNDSQEWLYAMKNSDGKLIDIHAFEYDTKGDNIYGIEYPYGSLEGRGVLGDREVDCITPEWMFKFKTAYQPKEKDKKDVRALSQRFGFNIPAGY